jgi:predicted O-methyltransferase YrrM
MNLSTVFHYINYRLTAYTEHDVHSPFVYTFYTELILKQDPYADFEVLKSLRKSLLNNPQLLEVTDLGAGSRKMATNKRAISNIARHGIAQKKQAEFLYRLVRRFSPKTMIELGTSIGLTSLYLSKASPDSTLYTIEGCPNISAFSKSLFQKQEAHSISTIQGNFNDELPKLLSQLNTVDFMYFDGNHAYEPTMRYFTMALEKKQASTIMVFDDIHWSAGMEQAWKEIRSNPEVTLSMDFFHFGIVFFRTEQKNKEHFVLKF